ncbi:cytochrome c4 (plasmid) [Burkholderia sp. SFA1]|uniref:NAD(P)/FAD-dependent oxidoreductase n=1 Tax=unclassified Caballeronia TaxID=2646786 RepID=UPI001F3C97C1|nr:MULTISPECIES: FAD-dependent oxidoreductase [unclassified Caballeronia]MCE4545589.1 FAD-binding oxidoreductase [Caballeronia sp. PC1]MCE4572287.1 FAD-binding oxidoreductase [Caballeronia sp. CLC5]BBQ00940.1 cytochrome c4 [Burkholderia sp. SFA1]
MSNVAIIGAGFIGMASAAWLMRDGHAVTLLDPSGVAQGASFGNAGTFAPYGCVPVNNPSVFRDIPRFLLSNDSPFRLRWRYLPQLAPWLARFLLSSRRANYEASAKALAALLSRAQEGYAPLLSDDGLQRFIRPRECLYLYSSAASFDAARDSLALRERLGVGFDVLDSGAIRELEPQLAPIFERGVLFRDSWHFSDPAAFLQALYERLVAQGARLERVKVDAIEPNAQGVSLRMNGEARRFDHVVVATGARSRTFAHQCGDDVPLDTERGYHVRYASASGLISRPCGWAERGFYMTPMSDGIRVAGTVELAGFTEARNRALLDLVTVSSKRALPALGTPDREWLGFRPTLPDGVPVIGAAKTSERVIYAFGHQHLGLTLAGVSGRIVADLVARRAPPVDLASYRASRFH